MILRQLRDESSLSEGAQGNIRLIMSQLNMLLSLVNDLLDIKMIQANQFEAKEKVFNPRAVIDFILDTFKFQSAMQNTDISCICVKQGAFEQVRELRMNFFSRGGGGGSGVNSDLEREKGEDALPLRIIGD